MKLYPNNQHQNFYEGWYYLGNDSECDYYVLPWELVDNGDRCTHGCHG